MRTWTQTRAHIRALMADLEAADDGSGEQTHTYLAANARLDTALRALPWWQRLHILYL